MLFQLRAIAIARAARNGNFVSFAKIEKFSEKKKSKNRTRRTFHQEKKAKPATQSSHYSCCVANVWSP